MKTAIYGRILLGGSAVLFGVIMLMWRDADTWQNSPLANLGPIVCGILALAQIVGGIGLPIPRTARAASIVLGAVYLVFSLATISSIVRHPAVYVAWGGFFEMFAMVCGAIAVYAVVQNDSAQAAMLGRIARIGMGVCAVSFTLEQAFYLKATAGYVPAWILPNPMFWAVFTTIAFALAAIAILINVQARLALNLMTLMIALFGLLIWVPAVITHPELHGNWSEFTLNFAIAGAAWVVVRTLP